MSLIDELEQAVDIVELAGRYTKLKKAGTNYKALCPFPGHSENTPSFVVSPVKQIGYCFGCHKGGGPIKFLMDIENCEFREAVQMLASITGKDIEGFSHDSAKTKVQKNLYSLYKDATYFYENTLKKYPDILKYLMDRGLTNDDISKFHLGYAASGVELYNFLKSQGYEDHLIEGSQIFVNLSQRKDKFIGRVIFPLQNNRGDFVAFAGRIVGQGEPKYLNSPASDIYDKSSFLYGLFDAKNTIIKKNRIIITEGYMDTIALHRAGYFETVAVSGTALTEKHIGLIKRLTKRIYLCFDGDKAGVHATKLSLELLKNKDLEVKIIEISGVKDPDEYISSGKDFEKLINTALSPIAFFIKKEHYNRESLDEKKKFLSLILEVIRTYADKVEQDQYLKEVAKLTDTPIKLLYELIQALPRTRQKKETLQKQKILAEDYIIGALLTDPSIKEMLLSTLLFSEAFSPVLQSLLSGEEQSLSLEQKEYYKARELEISLELQSEKEKNDLLVKLCTACNKEHFTILQTRYKQAINSGDNEVLQAYSILLQLAKKHQIK